MDTVQCGHCGRHQQVAKMDQAAKLFDFCRCCMKPTCRRCAAKGYCEPVEKAIERMEKDRRNVESYGVALR